MTLSSDTPDPGPIDSPATPVFVTQPREAAVAQRRDYLKPFAEEAVKVWPKNRTLNVVCHGHSVPAGYFNTPRVDTFNAYPHLMHVGLNERYPNAVINVIRVLAAEYRVGLVDSLALFKQVAHGTPLADIMSTGNHPNRAGHDIVAAGLMRWFPQ